jgi:hypothetical protein
MEAQWKPVPGQALQPVAPARGLQSFPGSLVLAEATQLQALRWVRAARVEEMPAREMLVQAPP